MWPWMSWSRGRVLTVISLPHRLLGKDLLNRQRHAAAVACVDDSWRKEEQGECDPIG